MMKGFDSRTSEMQIQICAGVNFYVLLLKNASILCFSLSLCLFFLFLFLFCFFLILFNCLLSFLWNKIVTGLVIYGDF